MERFFFKYSQELLTNQNLVACYLSVLEENEFKDHSAVTAELNKVSSIKIAFVK